jgi:S-adenosyl methyltransferase
MTALPEPAAASGMEPETPNLARMYDYYLGGSDHYVTDAVQAEQVCGVLPCMTMVARSNRAFLRRAVRFMAQAGIGQFIDIGSGLPTVVNTHEVAQSVNPDVRVVYVDNEPIAVNHGRRILAETANAVMIQADVREPDTLLNHPELTALGVLLGGVLVFIDQDEDPAGLVAAYRGACAPGSYLAVSHLTADDADPTTREQVNTMAEVYRGSGGVLYVRDRDEFTRWFDGTELVSPGVTLMADWRPDQVVDPAAADPEHWLGYGAVGRVP